MTINLFDIYGNEAVTAAVAEVLEGKCPRIALGHPDEVASGEGKDHESSMDVVRALSTLAFGKDAMPSDIDSKVQVYRAITSAFPGTELVITQG